MLVMSRLVRVDRVTLVELTVPSLQKQFRAVSVLHPEDQEERDEETGSLLAHGRAFERLSRFLIRQANGRIKMADNNRRAKEKSPLGGSVGRWAGDDSPTGKVKPDA